MHDAKIDRRGIGYNYLTHTHTHTHTRTHARARARATNVVKVNKIIVETPLRNARNCFSINEPRTYERVDQFANQYSRSRGIAEIFSVVPRKCNGWYLDTSAIPHANLSSVVL